MNIRNSHQLQIPWIVKNLAPSWPEKIIFGSFGFSVKQFCRSVLNKTKNKMYNKRFQIESCQLTWVLLLFHHFWVWGDGFLQNDILTRFYPQTKWAILQKMAESLDLGDRRLVLRYFCDLLLCSRTMNRADESKKFGN